MANVSLVIAKEDLSVLAVYKAAKTFTCPLLYTNKTKRISFKSMCAI